MYEKATVLIIDIINLFKRLYEIQIYCYYLELELRLVKNPRPNLVGTYTIIKMIIISSLNKSHLSNFTNNRKRPN